MSNSSPLPPAAGCHMMDSACSSSSSSISSSSNCSTSSIGSMENSGASLINQQLAFDDAPCTVNGWQQQQQQQQFFYAMPGGTYPTPPLYQEVQPQPPPPPPSQPQQPQQLQQTTVKPPKPKRKRVASQAQRKAANVRERRRMFNLNEAFDTLRTKVPTFAFEKRLSRIETLRLAITYIRFMGQVVSGVPPEQVRLRVACQQQQHQQQLMMSQHVEGAVPLEDLQQQQQQQQPFPQAWSQQHESSVASSSTAVWDQGSAGHRMHE